MIYHCYGRAHSSVVAAHLHLGNLPLKGPVHLQTILNLPKFDRSKKDDYGIPSWMGKDEMGNDIYIMGFGTFSQICARTMEDLFRIFGRSDEVLLVNALKPIGISARIGGGLSRGLGLVGIGRPLVAWGMRRSMDGMRRLIIEVKEVLEKRHG